MLGKCDMEADVIIVGTVLLELPRQLLPMIMVPRS
jgi:hypothetical protein